VVSSLSLTNAMNEFSVQTVQTKFDAKVLHEQPQLAAESGMVDDGKGAKEIFRVDRFDLLQVQGHPSAICNLYQTIAYMLATCPLFVGITVFKYLKY